MQLEKTSGHAVLWWLDLMETLQGRERWSWAPRERVLWLLLGEGGGGQLLVVSDLPFPQPHPSSPRAHLEKAADLEIGPTMRWVSQVPCVARCE